MLGTKCPSITSRWIQSAPAASTARTSSPSLEKSEARIEGAIARARGAKAWVMARFPVAAERTNGPRLTWAPRPGNAGTISFLWAENSAVVGMNCRCSPVLKTAVDTDFIELFALARRLLTSGPEHWPRHAARVGVVQCCLRLAPYRVRS